MPNPDRYKHSVFDWSGRHGGIMRDFAHFDKLAEWTMKEGKTEGWMWQCRHCDGRPRIICEDCISQELPSGYGEIWRKALDDIGVTWGGSAWISCHQETVDRALRLFARLWNGCDEPVSIWNTLQLVFQCQGDESQDCGIGPIVCFLELLLAYLKAEGLCNEYAIWEGPNKYRYERFNWEDPKVAPNKCECGMKGIDCETCWSNWHDNQGKVMP